MFLIETNKKKVLNETKSALAPTRTSRAGKHLLTCAACKMDIVSPPSEYALTPWSLASVASPEQIHPKAASLKQRVPLLQLLLRPVFQETTLDFPVSVRG